LEEDLLREWLMISSRFWYMRNKCEDLCYLGDAWVLSIILCYNERLDCLPLVRELYCFLEASDVSTSGVVIFRSLRLARLAPATPIYTSAKYTPESENTDENQH
jgi:hypothetical protein